MSGPSIFAQSSRSWLQNVADALVSVVFPADCRLCERLLTHGTRLPICDDCLASFHPMPSILCQVCGQPLQVTAPPAETDGQTSIDWPPPPIDASTLPCPACNASTFSFARARSYSIYQGLLARAIVMLKFERIDPLANWFAQRLQEIVHREPAALAADVVVSVPLHRDRYKERGYNQADLIAKPLAKLLKLPYQPVLLVRTRPRPDKQLLSFAERWEIVRGAFATRPGSQVDNKRVLLVDDVLTTGATLDACSQALRAAGAKSVIGLTIARAARQIIPGSPES
ncbi:MAG TPA: ComF family protein [Candidatus Acidoferrum sp.]